MKKCIFIHVPLMDYGGQERFVSKLITILKDSYDVKLVLFNDTSIGYSIDCEHFTLGVTSEPKWGIEKILQNIKIVLKFRALMKKYRPYTSISFGNSANWVNIIAGLGKCKTMISIRGYSSLSNIMKSGIKGFLWRLLCSKANKIICVSAIMAQELRRAIPGQKDKICVLYNAYDVNEIIAEAQQESMTDKWFDLHDVIVTVGTLRPEKGYWHLIKAFSLLKKKREHIKLLLVGPDQPDNGEKLKKLIRDLDLEEDVVLMGYQENPYKYCTKSRIYILSSITEGFPNALVEAMVCGIPVIAADCKTGPREILTDDNFEKVADDIELAAYGILIPPMSKTENYEPCELEASEKKLAEAMELLLINKELAQKYAIKSRERAADFTYERCREKISALIED